MSILIKGMEMPRKCIRCPVNVYGRCLVNDDKDVSKATADAVRDKDCPLVPVPPHGRLIDADEMLGHRFVGVVGEAEKSSYMVGWNTAIEAIVENAPAIIPASEDEGQS